MRAQAARLVVTDDGRRSRLTVFFRLLLALIHLLWLFLWTIGAFVAALVNWVATLVTGSPPRGLHGFLAAYVRYVTHVYAYLYLIADPFPGFNGEPRSYPVDVEIPPPDRQSRWTVGFRIVLALPAILLATALGAGIPQSGNFTDEESASTLGIGALGAVAFLGWFACLVRGRMPRGMRDLGAYALGYGAQVWAYLLVLTGRYPNSDPVPLLDTVESPRHPVRLALADDRARSRLTTFFRLPLAAPHLLWLTLWGVAAVFAAIANWFATLATARSPAPLQRFLGAYVRYGAHVYAFLYMVGNPFPGFVGRAGSYPVDVEIDRSERQGRWVTGFRAVLALPALVIAGALGNVLAVVAVLAWFAALVTRRAPLGLRNLGAVAVRYQAQTWAFLLVLTDRYPHSGPTDAAIGTRPLPPPPDEPRAPAPEPGAVPA